MSKVLLGTTITLLSLGIIAPTIGGTIPNTVILQIAKRPNCNNPQTQGEMNTCAEIDYQNANKKLNQVYQQLLPKLSASRQQKLVVAQQTWIKFRDASCEFEKSEVEGGSMAPMIYSGCLAKVTNQRTKDLESYLEINK